MYNKIKWGDVLCCFEVLFQQTENNIWQQTTRQYPNQLSHALNVKDQSGDLFVLGILSFFRPFDKKCSF